MPAGIDVGVALGHRRTATVTAILDVDTLVPCRRVTVIYPQKRTHLFALACGGHLTHAVGRELHYLARAEVAHELVTQIVETRTLARAHVTLVVLADRYGCAAETVACGIDRVVGEHQHRARALYLLLRGLDARAQRFAPSDEHGHQFGGVDGRPRQFGEVVAVAQQLLGQFVDVVDTRHRHHGIASQVRGDGNRLGLAVGDYAHAHFRRGELGQFALELVAEIAVLQRMYGSHEFFVRHEGHSRSFGTQMRVVVGTVEYVVNALLARDATEKTGHTNIS